MRIHQLDGLFFLGWRCCLPWLIWSLLAGDGFVYSEKKSPFWVFFLSNITLLFCCKSLFSLFHAFCDGPSYFVFFCDVSVVHCSTQLLSSEFSFFLYRYPHGYCYAYQAITTVSDQSSCDIKDVVNNDFDSLEVNEWLCGTTTATQLKKKTTDFVHETRPRMTKTEQKAHRLPTHSSTKK